MSIISKNDIKTRSFLQLLLLFASFRRLSPFLCNRQNMAALPALYKRDDAQSTAPFWISTVACVALLIGGIALAIFLYSCVDIKRRWRRRTLVGEANADMQEKLKSMMTGQNQVVPAAGQRAYPVINSTETATASNEPFSQSSRAEHGHTTGNGNPDTCSTNSNASKNQSSSPAPRPPPPSLPMNSWKSSAFASLKRKSVASIQWVGLHGPMDRRSQTLELSVANKS